MRTRATKLLIGFAAGAMVVVAVAAGAVDRPMNKGERRTSPPIVFDHNKTAFPLTGRHRAINCEACHTGGRYQELSTECGSCHKVPSHHAMDQRTVMVSGGCAGCHSTAAWTGASFPHTPALTAGKCDTCHNGRTTTGKPATHVVTTAQCDTCHASTTSFANAAFRHDAATTAGKCDTCHSGKTATGKPSTHIVTTAQCDTCHSTTSFATATYRHDATATGKCDTCHNGKTAPGKSTGHLVTTAQCDTCHTSTTSFATATFRHDATATGKCDTCHNGRTAMGKPTTHLVTAAQCDTCHTTTSFAGATFRHDPATTTGKCDTCHNGKTAPGKPSTHIVTTAQCDTCHRTTGWTPASYSNHVNPKLIGGHSGLECRTCHPQSFTTPFYRDGIQFGFCSNCHRRDYKYPGPDEHENAGTTLASSLQANANCANCHEHAGYRWD